jgi:hypothetical protein
VQEEVKMIKGLEGKVFEEINLEDDIEKQIDKIDGFSRRSTVFISHAFSMKDGEIFNKISKGLKKHDFGVYDFSKSIQIGDNWANCIEKAIDDAISDGFVIFLISKNSIMNTFVLVHHRNPCPLGKVRVQGFYH